MKRTTSVLSKAAFAAAILAAFFSASCNNALLPEPEMEKIQGAAGNRDSQIEAPLTVKATQGKTKVVTVSWSTSNGATQYIIYSAASPHEEFLQIAETKGEVNSIDIQEPAGTSAYYRVCARNYLKELSDFSDTVFGSTMATPIISGITSNTDGTAATVEWWMENCSASTYQNLVNYVVYCYDESGNEVTHATASGAQTSAVLSGLTAKTRYYYQVEAFVSADQSKPEYSDKVDEETARRLIPDAPENLSATQGTDKETIAVSWTLPQFCDVAVSGGVYERHPLYFTIERKLKGDDDSKYQKIVTYLGTQKKSAGTSVIQFSCNADEMAAINKAGVVSVSPAQQSDADAERSDIYPHYVSRSTVTYYDSTAERDMQYEYRVQSYVDDVKKTISADSACAAAEGFLLSKPAFSASAKYSRKDDDSNAITKISVSFRTAFEPFGQDYSYVLCRNFEPMETEDGPTGDPQRDVLIASASSISALNTETDVFDFGNKTFDIGYYQYVLYICAPGERDVSNSYDSITMGGKITVIDDASKLPSITRFDIADGYADKFILTWNYDENCHYRLEWKSSLDDFTDVQTLDIDTGALREITDGTATYEHAAQSGEVRTYTLVANGGIEVSKTYPLPESPDAGALEPARLETLGTASPQTQDIGYRTISVFWPNVQKATGEFGIRAYYQGDTAKTDLVAEKYKVSEAEDGWLCTITEPDGFDDPKRSGLPITMEITATSETGDTTVKAHTVRTLGPAALAARTNETPAENDISLTWNKAEGAEGYLIYRLAYTDRTCTAVERTSCYYCQLDGSLAVLGDFESDPNAGGVTRAQATSAGGTYTLKDIYTEHTAVESAYQSVQEKLCWGLPYGYIVLPVKDSADFAFEQDSVMLKAEESAVDYTADGKTLAKTIGSTLGYGLNLVADKAVSGSRQGIRWEEPYQARLPVVYRRAADSTNKFEKFSDDNAMKGKNTANMQIRDNYYDAFEYVVKYYSSYPDGSAIELPPSLLAQIKKNAADYDTPQGKKTELNNKGYLLTLGGFAVQPHPEIDYYEQILWNEWDYAKRAVGPDAMTVRVQNNNIDADFHDLVRIEKANARAGLQKSADDIKVEDEGSAVMCVAPEGIADGTKDTTDGLLKVLRDYKHYYTFTLKRGETTVAYEEYVGKENSIKTAYRQITNEELVRAATLAMAIGAKATGTSWSQGDDSKSKNGVTVSTSGGNGSHSLGGSYLVHKLEYTSFTPSMATKAGKDVTFLTINGKVTGETWKDWLGQGTSGNNRPPYEYVCYNDDKITVSAANDDCGGLYSAQIVFNYLNYEANYRDEGGTKKGIKITYPNGNSEKVFGNITPLPFNKSKSDRNNIDFQQDSAEWQ